MPQHGQPVQNRLEIDVSSIGEGLRRQSSNKKPDCGRLRLRRRAIERSG